MIHQLSFFIENRPGTLNRTLDIIKQENLQIIASSISDTAEYGIYRVIAAEPLKAFEALKKHDLLIRMTEVFAISLNNVAGTAAETISLFTRAGINIEYLYSFLWDKRGILILRTDNNELTQQVIREHRLVTLEEDNLVL